MTMSMITLTAFQPFVTYLLPAKKQTLFAWLCIKLVDQTLSEVFDLRQLRQTVQSDRLLAVDRSYLNPHRVLKQRCEKRATTTKQLHAKDGGKLIMWSDILTFEVF